MRNYCGKKIMSIIMTVLIGVAASSFCTVDAASNEKSAVALTQPKEVGASSWFWNKKTVCKVGAAIFVAAGLAYKYSGDKRLDDFKTKEQLLEELPRLWERFYVEGYSIVRSAKSQHPIDRVMAVNKKANDATVYALFTVFILTETAQMSESPDAYAIHAASNYLESVRLSDNVYMGKVADSKLFSRHWEKGGRLYEWVKNANEDSIRNLVKVLRKI